MWVAGCVERTVYVTGPAGAAVPPGEVVVTEAPPQPQLDVLVAAPGPGYVWTPGYWSWRGHWVWVGGRWVIAPHPRAVFVPGRWVRHGHGWVWVRGHWG